MNPYYFTKLQDALAKTSYDALLICPSEELNFLTDFSPIMCERFQGLFIKKDKTAFYFCNLLTGEEARHALGNQIPVYTWFDNDSMIDVISSLFEEQQLSGKTIGVNSSAQAFHILDIARQTGASFVNAVSFLEEIRIQKTEWELDCLRKAAAIADAAFGSVLPRIHVGLTEADVRDMLIAEMEERGGTDAGALVASGENAGYPHYCRYERSLRKGDCLIMDFGCLYQGLHSDMTRTIFIGSASKEQMDLYTLLYEAQEAAQKAAFNGAYIPDIDAAARRILAAKGYDLYFTTRIGHGIGYMTHEAPYIAAWNKRHLEKGMCFSIEPGIYIPGKLGIRIENILAVNLDGEREILNQSSRELYITDY